MAYIIDDNCTLCGMCEIQCPVECISEGEKRYLINATCCVDCGTCQEVCPVDAARPDKDSQAA